MRPAVTTIASLLLPPVMLESVEVCHFRDTTFLNHSLETETYVTGYYGP